MLKCRLVVDVGSDFHSLNFAPSAYHIMKPAVVHFLCSKVSNYHLYSTEKLGMWRNFTICLLPISELVRKHMRNARPRDIELLLCAGTM